MKIINGYFDDLEFWNSCYFSKPVIKNTDLIIPVRNIGLYEEHPLNNTGQLTILPEARLIFSGVQRSQRIINEYLGKPNSGKGFKPSYKVTDGSFTKNDKLVSQFFFEGILDEPLSYVTWEIDSMLFFLEVSENILAILNPDESTHPQTKIVA